MIRRIVEIAGGGSMPSVARCQAIVAGPASSPSTVSFPGCDRLLAVAWIAGCGLGVVSGARVRAGRGRNPRWIPVGRPSSSMRRCLRRTAIRCPRRECGCCNVTTIHCPLRTMTSGRPDDRAYRHASVPCRDRSGFREMAAIPTDPACQGTAGVRVALGGRGRSLLRNGHRGIVAATHVPARRTRRHCTRRHHPR